MTALKINQSTFERADIINHVLYPLKAISCGRDQDKAELARLVRDRPSALVAVGLIRAEVFAPVCDDPEKGAWHTAKHKVWVDKDSGVPIDTLTVKILTKFPVDPSKLTGRDLINLLPPTYWAREEDAAILTELFRKAGPLHQWPVMP